MLALYRRNIADADRDTIRDTINDIFPHILPHQRQDVDNLFGEVCWKDVPVETLDLLADPPRDDDSSLGFPHTAKSVNSDDVQYLESRVITAGSLSALRASIAAENDDEKDAKRPASGDELPKQNKRAKTD